MAIVDSIKRFIGGIVGNVVATIHTRLELISVEVEEELARFSSYLIWSLVIVICASIALLLGVLLVVALFWDTHRYAVLLSLIALFSFASIILAWRLKIALRNKPRFLQYTLEELRRDGVVLQKSDASSGTSSDTNSD